MTNDDVATGVTGTREAGDRRVGVSLGSLAFQVGHLGAGLGWHGSVATHRSTTFGEGFHLLEAVR